MVNDAHLAEDVTQGTFLALAKNATHLTDKTIISGWLHRTAQNLASKIVRADIRRRAREKEAAAMNELLSADADGGWKQIAPHLDAALNELSEEDRNAVIFRYFERKSAREMAQALGLSDDAAQKRVSRAVERLRRLLGERGVTVGTGALVTIICANAVQAAPVGLAVAISSSALAVGGSALCATATTTLFMTTLQKTAVGSVLIAALATATYNAKKASGLTAELRALRQQQAAVAEQLEQSNRDRDNARQSADRITRNSQADAAEMMRLRGNVARLRIQVADLATKRNAGAAVAQPPPPKRDLEAPEPVQIFVATADARVPSGQTLAVGGWSTLEGKRTIMLIEPAIGNPQTTEAPATIQLASRVFQIPDPILDKIISDLNLSRLEKLRTEERAVTSHEIFSGEETTRLVKALETTTGVELLAAPRVETMNGRQAVVSITRNQVIEGQMQVLGPTLDIEPRIAADGASFNLTVVARLRTSSVAPSPENP